jgi:hypothetical protein
VTDTPLTFAQVKIRFRFIDVSWCEPYGDGRGYFAGPDSSKRSSDFPYASGPRVFVGRHDPDELIPQDVIFNWLHRLGVLGKPLEQFWEAQDHDTGY